MILGIASFFVTLPEKHQEGIRVGGASIGVQTTTTQKLPAYVGVIMLVGGISMILAGSSRAR